MSQIILDSGPIISLSLNDLLWLFDKVKDYYGTTFSVTEAVKHEVLDHPLAGKRFKLEALQVMRLMKKGTFDVLKSPEIDALTNEMLPLANACYSAKGNKLQLVHYAEMSAIAAAILSKADAVMIDERTTRYLFEKPEKLRNVLQHKLHTPVELDKVVLAKLRRMAKNVKFTRSAEFTAVCFEKGLLDNLLPDMPKSKENLLDALLWALKLNGCAISTKDLETLLRLESK
ncbi:MAG: hypothetical protein Q7S65_03540 [Nanoarchaeota archaeon]|nr:hypothetical protein [Nanoarchaeota archaeon]